MIPLLPWTSALNAENEECMPSIPDLRILETKKGIVYHNCYVSRVEIDGIVIKHDGGMARISLFDLHASIQDYFNFDPVAAMAAYKRDKEVDRKLRKQVLLETEKFKAAEKRRAAQKELESLAVKNWIPAEGTIVKKTKEGIELPLYRIVLVPTEEISTLGLKREGPPKRQLHKFNAENVILMHVGEDQSIGDKWQGYVDPAPYRQPLAPYPKKQNIPVHRAISKR